MSKIKRILSMVLTIMMLCTTFLSTGVIVHASILPLEEQTVYLILNKETNEQLKAMSVSTILGKLQDTNGNAVSIAEDATTAWLCSKDSESGLETYDAYALDDSDGKKLDLSQPTGASAQTVELIIGKDGQLNNENIRYIIKVYYTGYNNNISYDLYSQSVDGKTRTKIEPLKKTYTNGSYEKIVDINGNPVPMFNAIYSVPEGDIINPYLGINCTISERPDVRVEFYELTDRYLTNPITDKLLNQDMTKIDAGYRMTDLGASFIVRFYIDGMDAGVQVYNFMIAGSFPHVTSDLFEVSSGNKSSVSNTVSEDVDMNNDIYTLQHELINGKVSNGIYRLNLTAKNGTIDLSNRVVKAVVGHYNSLTEAKSATDIKSELLSSGNGYEANYGGNGVDFTLFFEDGVIYDNLPYKLTIKAAEYASNLREFTDKPIIGEADPWIRVIGASDSSGNEYDTYVIENGKNINMDTYYGYGYQTVLINNANADLSKIKPDFWYANTERVYAVDETTGNRIDKNHTRDFSNENQQYAGIIIDKSNKENERNYWVTFKKLNNNGPELYVYGPSAREVILDEYFEFKHDILIANIGNRPLKNISVKLLDAENVKLDPYWTVGGAGNDTLAAFTTTLKSTKYGELANLAKIRLLPDGDGTVKGTLVITAEGQDPVMITLNGTAQNPEIITEQLEDAVKYVPYQHIVATNNMHDWVETKFSIDKGSLPDGISLNSDTGEIYGVPTVPVNDEEVTYAFTVKAEYYVDGHNGYFDPSYKELKILVKPNTDENVYKASDEADGSSNPDDGYAIKVPIGTQVGEYSFELEEISDTEFTSYGHYDEFVKLWLNGDLLEPGVDYDSESGSTKITIKSQTFENKANQNETNTIAMEFRKDNNGDGKGDSGAEMNRTSQNFTIKTKTTNTDVDKVIAQIAALPSNITLNDRSAVKSARSAYDALSQADQAKVTNRQKLFDAEAKIAKLEADKAAADKVTAAISTIPSIVNSDARDKIESARKAYDALSSDQKKLVTNCDRLVAAENALAQFDRDKAEANKVIALINAIPENISLEDKDAVNKARTAYNLLTADQKGYVTNYAKLQSAEQRLAELAVEAEEQAKINSVIAKINVIPNTVTLNDKDIVDTARTAYDTLNDSQKEKVINYERLVVAENAIAALEAQKTADLADVAAANEVVDLIDKLPENVTLEDKDTVETVRQAYEALSAKQKQLVSNYNDLVKAEATIKALEDYELASAKDKEAADNVIKLIDAIPDDVTLEEKSQIESARDAYDSLSEEQKSIVPNYDELVNAEAKIAELENNEYEETQSVTFIGVLVDKDGRTLADKIVEIHSTVQNGRTDENGSFQFNNVEFGKHTIYVKDNSGNIEAQKEFNILLGEPLSINEGEIVAQNGAVFTVSMQMDGSDLIFTGISEGNQAPVIDIDPDKGIDIDNGNENDNENKQNTDSNSPSKTVSDKTASPKTGDDTNLTLWYVVLIVSLSGLISMLTLEIANKRKKHTANRIR